MRIRWMVLTLLLVTVIGVPAAPDGQMAGTICDVRVYQGQALVTRQLRFQAKHGPQELVVSDLPEAIIPNSLYTAAAENISIRAVRYRRVPVAEETRPEVRELDRQIQKLKDKQSKLEHDRQVLADRSDFLDQVGQFASAKVIEEMRRGELQPQSLQQVTTFLTGQRREVANNQFDTQQQKKELSEQMQVLQRKRSELAGDGAKTRRQAVIFADAKGGKEKTLQLSYLVTDANWSPAYSARLNDGRDKIKLEYHGAVSQMSGENWPKVKLTLSTSYPTMEASSPILSPLRMNLVAAEQKKAAERVQAEQYRKQRRQMQQQLQMPAAAKGERGPTGPTGPQGPAGPQGDVGPRGPAGTPAPAAYSQKAQQKRAVTSNVVGARLQNMELTAPDEIARTATAEEREITEGFAANYPIDGKISIESRRDKQLFHIATLELDADFTYEAIPLLSSYVYQMVKCVNDSDMPLLAGEYSAYADGSFAGRGEMPLTAPGQGLAVGFGTESQLKASRQLKDKSTSIHGGNKVVEYSYRLSVENYMDEPATVRLWDRIPEAPDDGVSVELTEPGKPLSENPVYLQEQRPGGLLRWEVDVPANSAGADAFSFIYKFKIEFDKRFDIGKLQDRMMEDMEKDIRMMQKIRSGRLMKQ